MYRFTKINPIRYCYASSVPSTLPWSHTLACHFSVTFSPTAPAADASSVQSVPPTTEALPESVKSVDRVNVSMDAKKVRKKSKRRYKFDRIRQLQSLRVIKKHGLSYHGIDTTKDFLSPLEQMDADENQPPPATDDDLFFEALKERDKVEQDYTDVSVDEIRAESAKMEQYYHGDELRKQQILNRHPRDRPPPQETVIDSSKLAQFGTDFATLGIHPRLVEGLQWKGIGEPTDIQKKVIPHLLYKCGLIRDNNADSSIGKSPKRHIVEVCFFGERTGTGKTLAYLLPIIEAIKRDQEISHIPLRMNRPRALILAPTRELCEQIRGVVLDLQHFVGISSYVLTAGMSDKKQIKKLRHGVDIVVGTPQRIKQHIDRSQGLKKHSANMFSLVDTRYVVLDEGDVLLNEGFWDTQVQEILSRIGCMKANEVEVTPNLKVAGGLQKQNKISKYSKPIQIVMCSASLTQKDISTFCNHLGFSPGLRMINGESLHCILPAMNMFFYDVSGEKCDKLQTLKAVLRNEQLIYNKKVRAQYQENLDPQLLYSQYEKARRVHVAGGNSVPQQTMIFCRTKGCAAAVSHYLDENNYENVLYFGVDAPFERKLKYASFTSGDISILVSTDVGMRGLDISNVSHVVLYDFPHSTRAFIHRVGRTGRINTVSNYEDKQSKVSALIAKHDTFIAAAILTAMNNGQSLIDLNVNTRQYKAFPHLKLKTAASHTDTHNPKLVPFEPIPVQKLTTAEIAEQKKAKKMGKYYDKYKRRLQKHKHVNSPRMWWYADRVAKTRVPFFNIRKKVVRRLMNEKDEDHRRELLLRFTKDRNRELPGGWHNNRNRWRMKKPQDWKAQRSRRFLKMK